MGFLSVIRRWALRDKMPIREISRRTGLSRNTIRKYLRADIVEPSFRTPTRPSKLDPFAEKLSGWLVTEQRKSRKDRRTAKQMHADLVTLGFDGSYERVAAFVRAWKADRQQAQQTTGARNVRAVGVSDQARRSSLTGARTGPMSAANASNFRWLISSCRTAVRFWCGPICCRRMRCCSMPIGMPSVCSGGIPAEASTTT